MLIDGKFYSDPEAISYIKKLKNTIAMNEESQKISDSVVEQLKQENAELKSMLKLVTKDISSFKTFLTKNNCRLPCEKCLLFNDGKDKCGYKHMTEIKKLISDK